MKYTTYFQEAGAPEGTPSRGGAGSSEATPKSDGTLTQEQVNAIVARERKVWEGKLKETQNQLAEVTGQMTEFRSMWDQIMSELPDEEPPADTKPGTPADPYAEFERELAIPPGTKDPNTYREMARRSFLLRKTIGGYESELGTLRKTVQELVEHNKQSQTAAERAERLRVETLRDMTLQQALVAQRCIDPAIGVRLFRDNVALNSKTGQFEYTDAKGQTHSIEEAVKQFLPAYMIQPLTETGGSGASGSGVRGQPVPTDQELAAMEQELKEAQETARKTGARFGDVSRIQALQRQLGELRARKAAASK